MIVSALRTLQVLQAFNTPPYRLGLAEVIERLGIERNQAYRSLKTLEAAGFIVQGDDARFEPGPVITSLASTAARFRSSSLVDVARPHLDAIAEMTHESVHLFVRSGDRAVLIDRRESPQSVRLVSLLGRSLPLHAGATPKAMLAWLPPEEQRTIIASVTALPAYTPLTVRDPLALERELDAIRVQGYAVSDGDFDAEARGAGAAIFGRDGSVVGGVSVGGPSFRIDDTRLAWFATIARDAAQAISHDLALAADG